MFDMIITNGNIVEPERVYKANLGIIAGKIAAITTENFPAKVTIDAEGKYIFPGMIDTHVHLNDPGFTWREDLEHGSAAAAVGGTTTILDMPLQNEPALTSAAIYATKDKVFKSRSSVDYAFWGGLVADNLEDFVAMNEAGAIAFKAFIGPVSPDYSTVDMGTIRQALQEIQKFNGLAGFHCEDISIIFKEQDRVKKEGRDTLEAYLETRPIIAEVIATQNIIDLAREIGAKVYICHVSCPEVASIIKKAQSEGISVTGETCSHYLVFTEEDVINKGTLFKCSPPLRSKEKQEELWSYVIDGTLSCLGSDHSPCRLDEKDLATHGALGAWGGISGLQSLLQVLFDQVVSRRNHSPSLIARMILSAAKTFSIDHCKGSLTLGLDADFVIIDPQKEWKITSESLLYLNQHSAFVGLEGKGLPVLTVLRGQVIAKDGSLIATGNGTLIRKKP